MDNAEVDEKSATLRLSGRCVLIVEDEYFLAAGLEQELEQIGVDVVGPVSSLAQAMALIQKRPIDVAVLDIKLDGDKVYDVADALIERSVPILFVTGYDRNDILSRYADVPMCQKPVGNDEVITVLNRIVFS